MADIVNEGLEEGRRRIEAAQGEVLEILKNPLERLERTDDKIRDQFTAFDSDGNIFARGAIYEQGNVQLSFRAGIGETAEQWSTIGVFRDTFRDIIARIDFCSEGAVND